MAHINEDDVDLIVLGSDDNEVDIKSIYPKCQFINLKTHITVSQYNSLLTNKMFWNRLKAYDRVLIFQSDSMLLKKIPSKFFDYDYVGAPWPFQLEGGNGGLSIRNPKKMIDVIEKFPYEFHRHGNEDVYFSNHLPLAGGSLAPRQVCQQFSVESIFKLGTVGYHAIDKYLTPDQCQQIKNQYKKP
jgi:hypothetical protein